MILLCKRGMCRPLVRWTDSLHVRLGPPVMGPSYDARVKVLYTVFTVYTVHLLGCLLKFA